MVSVFRLLLTLRRVILFFPFWVGALTLSAATTNASDQRRVFLPFIFHAEAQDFLTTACIELTQSRLPSNQWWLDTKRDDALERSFAKVIKAINAKDRESLLKLSHPTLGRDPSKFAEQASAFFQQFGSVELTSVRHAFRFDSFGVLFATLEIKGKTITVPFVFALNANNQYAFLPYRTEDLIYVLLKDWAMSKWGITGFDTATTYCKEKTVRDANYRVPITASTKPQFPAFLLLRGYPAAGSAGRSNHASARAVEAVKNLPEVAIPSKGRLSSSLTPEGAGRLSEWLNSASDVEKEAYVSALKELDSQFVFDANPLMIVYAKRLNGNLEVLYFTPGSKNELLWTNSSHLTNADDLFKRGTMIETANKRDPFKEHSVH